MPWQSCVEATSSLPYFSGGNSPRLSRRRSALLGSVAGCLIVTALFSPLLLSSPLLVTPAHAADGDGGTGGGSIYVGSGAGGIADLTGPGGTGGTGSDTYVPTTGGGGGGSGIVGGDGGAGSTGGGIGGTGSGSPGADGGDGQTAGNNNSGGGGGGGAHGYVGTLGALPASMITGGNGGNGGEAGFAGYGGGGGGGGFGAVITGLTGGIANIDAGNVPAISGGQGGDYGWGAVGGNGGSGLVLHQATGTNTLVIGAALNGGAGGSGIGSASYQGGNGGSGFALQGGDGNNVVTLEGAVTGGAAGAGNAVGADGGHGIVVSGTSGNNTLVIKADVVGGAATDGLFGSGRGGDGIRATNTTGRTEILVQAGVTGGASGTGASPIGGAGISGSGLTIILDGATASITGGAQGMGRASAIAFTGGRNTLELRADAGGNLGTITGALTGVGSTDRFVLGGDNNVAADFTGAIGTYAGSGFGTLEKAGTSRWTITDGDVGNGMQVIVSEGTLRLAGSATLANATGVTVNGALDLSGLTGTSASIGNLSGTDSGASITLGELNLTVLQALDGNSARTGSGTLTVAGSGTLTRVGAGTLILSGSNTYVGGTNLGEGTLVISSAPAPGGIDLTVNQSLDGTYAGTISGTGGLVKMGSATLTLAGIGSYLGGTTVGEGTLVVGSATALPLFSDVSISAGATLDLNGYGASLHSLAGEGTLETGSQGAIYLYHGGTFAGAITGASAPWPGPAAFVFSAPGETLTLSGNSDFGGYFSLNGGTLVSTGNSTFGGVAFWGGTFEVTGGATILDSYIVANGAAATPEITVSGGGSLTITDGLYLANYTGTGGEVVVSGDGSALDVLGELYVAYGGVGRLTVSGGSVSINGGTGTIELAGGANGSGTLVIGSAAGSPASAPGIVRAESVGASGGAGTVVFNHTSGAYYFTSDGTASGTPVLITQNVDPTAGGTGQTSVSVEAGTTYFLADNDYTGMTTINGGTLSLGNGGISGSIVGPALINTDGTLQFYRADNISYTGTLSGSGALVKAGAGALNYTGDGTAFTGTTTVAAGKLSVNGTLGGAVDVLSGGTLGGNGTMGPVTLGSGATVAPGNSIGTLHVNGDITFSPGSVYQVELAGNGTSDLIVATGQAVLNGAGVQLIAFDPQTSYQNGVTYTILTATGGVVGSFGAVTTNSIFLTANVNDLATGVNVIVAIDVPTPPGPPAPPAVFTSVAVTPNQFATAAALDTLAQVGPSLALYNSLLFLNSASEARLAYDQLSGEVHASAQSVFMEQSSLIRGALNDRLRAAQGGVGASVGSVVSVVETASGALAYAAPSKVQVAADMSMPLKAAPMAALAPAERFALWTTGFGNWGTFNGNTNAAGVSDSTGGFLIGADTLVGDGWRVGVAGGYSYTDFSITGRNSSGNSDNWHAALYAGKSWDALALRTGLAYTWQDVSTSRSVAFTGFADSLSADYSAGTFQAFGELGWRIDTAFAAFEPFANLAYVSLDTDGYGESGGAAALYSDGADMDTTFTTIGLRASKDIVLGTYEATLRGTLGWRHAFGDITPSVSQAFLTSDAFTVTGVPIAQDAAVLEAGLDVRVGAMTTLGIAYTGQFGDGVQQNGFNATLKVSF